MKKFLKKLGFLFGKKAVEIFFPNHCLSCEKIISKDGLFCHDCWTKLQFISEPKCRICAYPFNKISAQTSNDKTNLICSNCLIKKPFFDRVITLFRYNQMIRKIVSNLKYRDQIFLAKKFSKILSQKAQPEIANADFIVAVPLHKKRLQKRKFNQAVLLCRELLKQQKSAELKFFPDFLIRNKNTIPQVQLRRKERQKNLQKVFLVNEKYHNLVSGKKFLLVDDVMTSGSTVENCALALKKLGAKEVIVLTIAKTIFGSAITNHPK